MQISFIYPHIRVLLLFLLSFTFFRLVFFFIYVGTDASWSYLQTLIAFIVGMRFDLATSMILLVLPLTLSLIPFKNKIYKTILHIYIQITFFVMLIIMTVDLIYYGYAHKRISFEFLIFFNDPIEISRFIFKSFWIIFLLIPFIFYFLNRTFKNYFILTNLNNQKCSLFNSLFLIIFIVIFSIFSIRGGWQGRPLKPIMAFQNANLPLGHLGMNGLYNILTTLYKSESYPIKDDWQKGTTILRNMLGGAHDKFISKEYPFYRRSKFKKQAKKRNIILIVMESWGYDDLGRSGNKKNVTPFFDQLTKKGLLYTQHYTPGSRTIQMFPAIVSSIPALFGHIFTTSSYQYNHQWSLANILTTEGYKTFFIYAAKENSMGFSSYANLIGFQKIISKEDFNLSEVEQDGAWGVYDEYAFQRFLEEAKEAKKPFFGMIKTIHPHLPHSVPSHHKKRFPINMNFYDDMRYTDFCLKSFFDKVRKEDYYSNTLFIITGDHAYGNKKTLALHHTPLLFYAPDFIPQGENDLLSSQLDIMPTILEILNLSTVHASMGKSIWSKKKRSKSKLSISFNWSFIDMDHTVGFMSDQYILISSRKKTLSMYDFMIDPTLNNNLMDDVSVENIKREMTKKWNIYASAIGYAIMNDKIMPR